MFTSEKGVKPCGGGAYGVSIDASTALTVPTPAQRASKATVLWCRVSVEGTQGFRVRWDGTAPTATVGIPYIAPVALTPTSITIVGDEMIAAFRIMGSAAGNTMSYAFYQTDARP